MDQIMFKKLLLLAFGPAFIILFLYCFELSVVKDVVVQTLTIYILRRVLSFIGKACYNHKAWYNIQTHRLALTWKEQDGKEEIISSTQLCDTLQKMDSATLLPVLLTHAVRDKEAKDIKRVMTWLVELRKLPISNTAFIVLPATPVYLDNNETMRFEQLRFGSFNGLPLIELPPGTNPTRLASQGYYFDRRRGRVRCFACGRSHGSRHVEDCDRERENEPFCRAPPPPLQEYDPPMAQTFNVIPRPPTPELEKPKAATVQAQAAVQSHPIPSVSGAAGSQLQGGMPPTYRATAADHPDGGFHFPSHAPTVLESDADESVESEEGPGAVRGEKPTITQSNFLRAHQHEACRQCPRGPAVIVFLPCGHITSCDTCSTTMTECDVCHEEIRGRDRVHST